MNRPSRTDDDFEHPTWNQNPPYLAADLTTCQDLNGIANSRELEKSAGGTGTAFGMDENPGVLLNSSADEDITEKICQLDALRCRCLSSDEIPLTAC
jgi:solute carrier family 39 (zinc transporter), member 1/2/3